MVGERGQRAVVTESQGAVGWLWAGAVRSFQESGLQWVASFLPVFVQTDSGSSMSVPQPAVPELSPAEEAEGPEGKVCGGGPGVCQPWGTGGSQPQALARDLGHASVYPSGWETWLLFCRNLSLPGLLGTTVEPREPLQRRTEVAGAVGGIREERGAPELAV